MAATKGCLRVLLAGFLIVASFCTEGSAWGQAIGFVPTPAPFPSGSILNVTPAVSADRRYVRLGIDVTFSQLIGFTTYNVPAAVSGGGAGMLGPLGGLGGAGATGGLGAHNGFRSAGLGETTVTDAAPGVAFGSPAGDPFEQALRDPVTTSSPATPAPLQATKPREGARGSRVHPTQSRRRGASRPQHPVNRHRKSTSSVSSYGEQANRPEFSMEDFPWES